MEDAGGKDGGGRLGGVLPAGENRLLWTLTLEKQRNESVTLMLFI